MTAILHDHIHLAVYTGQSTLDSTALAASTYHLLMPGMEPEVETAAAVERGLTGSAHVFVTADDNGDPLVFHNGILTIMATTEELSRLFKLSGKRCYLALNLHDDDTFSIDTDNGRHVLVALKTYRMLDPYQTYWLATISVVDLT